MPTDRHLELVQDYHGYLDMVDRTQRAMAGDRQVLDQLINVDLPLLLLEWRLQRDTLREIAAHGRECCPEVMLLAKHALTGRVQE